MLEKLHCRVGKVISDVFAKLNVKLTSVNVKRMESCVIPSAMRVCHVKTNSTNVIQNLPLAINSGKKPLVFKLG